MPATQPSDVRNCTGYVRIRREGTLANTAGGCAVLYSPCRDTSICSAFMFRFDGASATTPEESARRIRELEQTVRALEDQNVQLKIAAREFGALAEGLNPRLMAEPRRSWHVRVRETLAGLTGQFGLSRLRT
jgi:hypothetical protein